jgi:hypothetical protein
LFVALAALSGMSQTAKRAPGDDKEARTLVETLLSQRPPKDLFIRGIFKIRPSDGPRIEVPVEYSVRLMATNWESVYQTKATAAQGPEELIITHQTNAPNSYSFTRLGADGTPTNSVYLRGLQAALPFAMTDFWLSDLGMEFLHWPEQRLVRDAKITMRQGRQCKVLESTNPHPETGNYARVVSWIDAQMGGLIRAEAYDQRGKRFKIFSLKGFEKVDGRWQVKDLEIQNDKTDSRTLLEFTFNEP